MSLSIINKLINFIINKLNINEKEIIIKTIKFDNDDVYTIEFKIYDDLYSIRHFEPLEMIQDVNYGIGYYYDCCIFDKEKDYYISIDINKTILKNS